MAIKVNIPTSFCLSANIDDGPIFVAGGSFADVCNFFKKGYPSIAEQLWDGEGNFKRNVLVAVDGELINKKLITGATLSDNSELDIMLQFAGG